MAHTLLSTRPMGSATSRTTSSVMSVVTPEARLGQAIQSPPMQRVGVLELDSFYPAKERFELAMRLNNLLAAPGFQVWMKGQPLDVGSLLYTDSGKPRVAIVSIRCAAGPGGQTSMTSGQTTRKSSASARARRSKSRPVRVSP